jgi:hypothetical protein
MAVAAPKAIVPASETPNLNPLKDTERIRTARLARFGIGVGAAKEPPTITPSLLPEDASVTITDTIYEPPIPSMNRRKRVPRVEPDVEMTDLTGDRVK